MRAANKQPGSSKSITDCFSAMPGPSTTNRPSTINQASATNQPSGPSKKRQREEHEISQENPTILVTMDGDNSLPSNNTLNPDLNKTSNTEKKCNLCGQTS